MANAKEETIFMHCLPSFHDLNTTVGKEIYEKFGDKYDLNGMEVSEDVMASTKDADVIYTDIWVSMGEAEEVWGKRIEELHPYQVNKKTRLKS